MNYDFIDSQLFFRLVCLMYILLLFIDDILSLYIQFKHKKCYELRVLNHIICSLFFM